MAPRWPRSAPRGRRGRRRRTPPARHDGRALPWSDHYTDCLLRLPLYYELHPELQQRVLPLKAEHSYLAKYEDLRAKNPWRPKLSQAQIDQVAPAVQPVVRTHPETGRKALFVSEHFTTGIVGLPKDESDALLAELFAHSVKPEFVYRHQWKPYDLVFWDNRSLMHLAAGTPDHLRRRLNRTTVVGDTPF